MSITRRTTAALLVATIGAITLAACTGGPDWDRYRSAVTDACSSAVLAEAGATGMTTKVENKLSVRTEDPDVFGEAVGAYDVRVRFVLQGGESQTWNCFTNVSNPSNIKTFKFDRIS
jgi:hypothetical protein